MTLERVERTVISGPVVEGSLVVLCTNRFREFNDFLDDVTGCLYVTTEHSERYEGMVEIYEGVSMSAMAMALPLVNCCLQTYSFE